MKIIIIICCLFIAVRSLIDMIKSYKEEKRIIEYYENLYKDDNEWI